MDVREIHDIHVCFRAETGPRGVARLMSAFSHKETLPNGPAAISFTPPLPVQNGHGAGLLIVKSAR